MRYRKKLLFYVVGAASTFLFGIYVLNVALQNVSTTPRDEMHHLLRNRKLDISVFDPVTLQPRQNISESANTIDNVTEVRNVYEKVDKLLASVNSGYFNSGHCSHNDTFVALLPVEIVSEAVYVYSTFYDNRTAPAKLRFIAMVAKEYNEKLWCHFQHGLLNVMYHSSEVEYYQMCENRNLPYGGWILSCLVPDVLDRIPCRVIMSRSRWHLTFTDMPVLNVTTIRHHKKPNNYDARNSPHPPRIAVCVPPIHSDIAATRIIEFLEFAVLLGAKNVFLYTLTDNQYVLETIRYYETKGVAIVLPWKLPFGDHIETFSINRYNQTRRKVIMSIWYHGQSVAINDCLYRTMSNFDITLFSDLDEFLVPGGDISDWPELLSTIQKPNISGYSFKTAYFSRQLKNSTFESMSSVRTTNFSKLRGKVAVHPLMVFEIGIHHVSRTVLTSPRYAPIAVAPEVAFIHHVRKCVREKTLNCSATVTDRTVQTKYQELEGNIQRVVSKFGFKIP